ncbi:Asp-tRNA(Asn)/Glu-tRNA(Gln) amidotransferase subunit GatC [bacterium]|nr:Asp-tRNA(Asn)/Glu-tRNA(Gln) amidotransferase subunit GatC [bacterium]
MLKISKKNVEYVARLARLKLRETEKEEHAEQLNKILGYMDKLNQLDTTHIKPTSHVVEMQKNVFREDAATPSIPVDNALQNAPDKKDSFFRVPKVIA